MLLCTLLSSFFTHFRSLNSNDSDDKSRW
jgi:hypothetical protein